MIADMSESNCACGSGTLYEQCCEPAITGATPASTAEVLMRSRYTAYTRGEIDYVVESNHSDTRDEINRDEVERWSRESDWLGLTIHETEAGETGDDEGTVTFTARYRLDGHAHDHRERSSFLREDGQWRFHSVLGDVDEIELTPVQPASTVGRNDPCPCGSGTKYKKCHGAAAAPPPEAVTAP